jgi:uncharacterized membrane-anchored protein
MCGYPAFAATMVRPFGGLSKQCDNGSIQEPAMHDHPLRQVLHNEVHARPPEPMPVPLAISHIVMWADRAEREASRQHLARLLADHHLASPGPDSTHLRVDLGAWRLRWELHTEFVSWTFMREADAHTLAHSDPATALHAVPQAWLAALPGAALTKLHLWAMPAKAMETGDFARILQDDSVVASTLSDGQAEVHTDFQIHADGFARMVLFVGSVTQRRTGRLVQQLLEIETYRMAALLGLPAARQAGAALSDAERELAELAQAIRNADRSSEAALLYRLTTLAGQVEGQYAATHSRFSATKAYFELVDRRILDIRESRLAGQQTIAEFMERRLTPARSTCEWAVRRQTALSERVSRMSNLLRTRVEIEQQQSSQDLLSAMNRRQGLQLKLQSTVEGLSVAAITYYMTGLVHYMAEGLVHFGWPFGVTPTTAAAVPIIAGVVWWFMRRLHNKLELGD